MAVTRYCKGCRESHSDWFDNGKRRYCKICNRLRNNKRTKKQRSKSYEQNKPQWRGDKFALDSWVRSKLLPDYSNDFFGNASDYKKADDLRFLVKQLNGNSGKAKYTLDHVLPIGTITTRQDGKNVIGRHHVNNLAVITIDANKAISNRREIDDSRLYSEMAMVVDDCYFEANQTKTISTVREKITKCLGYSTQRENEYTGGKKMPQFGEDGYEYEEGDTPFEEWGVDWDSLSEEQRIRFTTIPELPFAFKPKPALSVYESLEKIFPVVHPDRMYLTGWAYQIELAEMLLSGEPDNQTMLSGDGFSRESVDWAISHLQDMSLCAQQGWAYPRMEDVVRWRFERLDEPVGYVPPSEPDKPEPKDYSPIKQLKQLSHKYRLKNGWPLFWNPRPLNKMPKNYFIKPLIGGAIS